MIKIQEIEENSQAQEVGILPGDKIVKINGEKIRDNLDWEFFRTDDFLEFEILREKETFHFQIEREMDKSLGLEPRIMPIHICKNNCVFCFVHQTPKGMRKSLYVKDEDYRYSFLDGHFTTLSNMREKDWQRVIDQNLSPLYISVHATNHSLRQELLVNYKIEPILDRLKWLKDHGIMFHTQMVIVPELNDKEELERSIRELLQFLPILQSISIVPVGLTRYREGLPDLRTLTPEEAGDCIDRAEKWIKELKTQNIIDMIHPSDELYILSEREIPPTEFYGDYSQYQNGVGTIRALLEDFEKELPYIEDAPDGWEVTVLTAQLANKFIFQIFENLNVSKKLKSEVIVCENITFGESVTCSGLLGGNDLLEGLKKSRFKGPVFVPPNCLNNDNLLIDDMTLDDISKKIGRPVKITTQFKDFFP